MIQTPNRISINNATPSRKGIEMSMNLIVIAVMVLLVMIILIYMFGGAASNFNKGITDCQTKGGTQITCGGTCPKNMIRNPLGDKGTQCCCIKNPALTS